MTMYSNETCSKCKMLKERLLKKNIKYDIEQDNFDELIEHGFTTVPILKVNNEFLTFHDAIKFVNSI